MKAWPVVGATGARVPEEVEPFGEHFNHRLCVLFLSHVFHQGKPESAEEPDGIFHSIRGVSIDMILGSCLQILFAS